MSSFSDAVCRIQEDAALHAAGMLEPAAAKSFEKRAGAGCPLCLSELRESANGFAAVALQQAPVAPPAGLKARLLQRTSGQTDSNPYATAGYGDVRTLLAAEGDWLPVSPGVTRKGLHFDKARNTATFLLKLEPGAVLGGHQHGGEEQCLVLQGEVEDGGMTLRQGDFQVLKPGSVHSPSTSKGGCLLLIVAAEPAATRFV